MSETSIEPSTAAPKSVHPSLRNRLESSCTSMPICSVVAVSISTTSRRSLESQTHCALFCVGLDEKNSLPFTDKTMPTSL